MMIYTIIGVSLIFIVVAYAVTENNASQILSGYNTMSKEEQKKFDIKAYIPFFKKFHIILGLTCMFGGLLLFYFISKKAAILFISLYPIVAYIYFIQKSNIFYKKQVKQTNKWIQLFMIAILVFIIIMVLLKEFF
ncbi:hypothetical protein APS56_07565 [Pseudalgibacter alginicilyticus]|uniref:DUF3784 domain-containing protein n=1 Tax=Pseudalgibacter alginicilyticus TaxID=1736674 RepID=A0A0P0CFP7_9FLAO|nr:DUF3784 domain-containing protein [Pseudalgibacter alginicilyticus]ALJ04989.1 hypothetical protein APS56_07565 [Pseudalgibacter alginicilyticus]